ncbi:MAG: hypothetical protein A3F33_03970 [Candidatus Woykebacteria bacterium RIFCSPHIGHO2_12_FULL_43_10]|uniref:Acyl carrier protein n=2 Tax=Candidatus Woykeibacteriota TaxID=1817899 RepID=A0A1G1WWU3_9BACT|nr:MAG: hypothetical protein A3J50_03995 [Candidatus Woykebacteria bacterium RIFCSPHIGHO2_02_FULL_43_16b]OGY28642.1 MAG: hypothetical protein A2802_01100 [Candidatus Woykebacteria bacterium RIFCSPHIGHO2_01_FULL_43_29]OGY29048.1 MAG: hypothetical protein A3F33_03970 [Candidatus Woykebacteria bacterium RIFCSPHIGHO2_12_FULL_43_10]OGY32183.1 MAG: hypothetical protein A3A61_01550 [Candidatus Woykebacteria bacterium RIFCSPLOWO2_01_FULL_43_14]
MTNVLEELINIVSLKLGVPKGDIHEDSHFSIDLNSDPISIADIITAVENKFGINLPREELAKVDTISDLNELVSERVNF